MTSLKKVVIAKKPLIINVSAIFVQKVMTTWWQVKKKVVIAKNRL